jgi:TPR repeat protein
MNKVIKILLGKKESVSSKVVTEDIIQSDITNFEFEEKSNEKSGDDPFTLGIQYLSRGNINEAKKWLLIASAKGSPDAMYKLAEIYRIEGFDSFADLWLKKANKQ